MSLLLPCSATRESDPVASSSSCSSSSVCRRGADILMIFSRTDRSAKSSFLGMVTSLRWHCGVGPLPWFSLEPRHPLPQQEARLSSTSQLPTAMNSISISSSHDNRSSSSSSSDPVQRDSLRGCAGSLCNIYSNLRQSRRLRAARHPTRTWQWVCSPPTAKPLIYVIERHQERLRPRRFRLAGSPPLPLHLLPLLPRLVLLRR